MIRLIEERDLAKVYAIINSTEIFSDEEKKEACEDIYCFEEYLDHSVYVYEENEEILGYLILCQRPLTDGVFDVCWIDVVKQSAGKGIGTQLLNFAEDKVKQYGGRWVILETSGLPMYEGTRSFYLKKGYNLLVEINDWYKLNDSITMYGKRI